MKRFFNISDLQDYLSDLPINSSPIEVELSVGEHKLKDTWVIHHKLILVGMAEEESEEHSFPDAPHLHLVSYSKSHQSKIIGDVNQNLIEIRNHVVFKNLLIQRGLDEDKEKNKENGNVISIHGDASLKAYHCVFHAFQHNEDYPKYQAIELQEKAKAYLSHCKIISNQLAHGIYVKVQYFKRKYKHDLVLNHCQITSTLTAVYVAEGGNLKISNTSIKHSVENAIYQLGDLIELYHIKMIDSGHHALSLINGKAIIKGMLAKQIKFSGISAYIKCKSTDIEKDVPFTIENADLIVEDLEVYQAGESAIFLHENTKAFAKKIKANDIEQVVFKSSAASQLYIEDAHVIQCKGCSLASIDLGEIIAKKVKLSAGDWGSIYIDSCAKIFLDELKENVEGTQIDILGASQLDLGEHDEQMKSFLKQAYARRVSWNEEKWLTIFKDRTNRFEVNTRKRMAYLFREFCKKNKDRKIKEHLSLEPYIHQWGSFGEKALYPFWVKIGSPNSITFDQDQTLKHSFECLKKEINIQEHELLKERMIGLSFANNTCFVFTLTHIYDYQLDEENDHLVFVQKRNLWKGAVPISDKNARALHIVSQNSKHYVILEYKAYISYSLMLLVYDFIDGESKYYSLDNDTIGFYPKDEKIITFGWDSSGHPTDRCTWKKDVTTPYAPMETIDYSGVTPKEPWLWHRDQQVTALLEHEYQVEVVHQKLSIRTMQSPQRIVYEAPERADYFATYHDYVICATDHELFLIKKKNLIVD